MTIPKDVGERVTLCPDGKYRWIYEMNMLKNPSILFDVWKVFGISFVIMVAIVLIICLFSGDLDLKMLAGLGKGLGIAAGAIAAISIPGYLLFAAISGWKYVVLFIMDEKEVVHKQLPGTEGKARAIGKLTALGGVAGGKPGMVGMGILAATRTSMSTSYSSVRRIIPCRRQHLIKMRERFSRNMVFVGDEDFDFVYQYLSDHCPNARKG